MSRFHTEGALYSLPLSLILRIIQKTTLLLLGTLLVVCKLKYVCKFTCARFFYLCET